ncbi:hypothetical protein [Fusobacterium ulcerans]|uniref:hypothetical protein n=1 Tax=Fusobacterium ulcerans TaxID=861 RepID=UPI00241DE577|nr:hypothetical protein [Fusobacterium ulcerans]
MDKLDKALINKINKVVTAMKDKEVTSCFINIKKNRNGAVEEVTITNTKRL